MTKLKIFYKENEIVSSETSKIIKCKNQKFEDNLIVKFVEVEEIQQIIVYDGDDDVLLYFDLPSEFNINSSRFGDVINSFSNKRWYSSNYVSHYLYYNIDGYLYVTSANNSLLSNKTEGQIKKTDVISSSGDYYFDTTTHGGGPN